MAARGRRPAPAASRVLAGVRRQLSEGWPPGLTVLSGDDLYHLDAAQRELLETLVPEDESDFALSLFGSERVDVATVVSAARSVGMFASRRVVFVRDAAMLDGEPAAIAEYAAAPPPGSHLLVRAPALDKRRKLHKTLAASGQLLLFAAPDGFDARRLVEDVAALARERQVALEPAAAELLAQLHGTDLYRVAGELEKIRAWAGDSREPLGVDTVREVASGGGAISGWEVADAVVLRDRKRALAAARRLVDGGEEPLRILGGLAWRARLLIQAKALQAARKSADPVVRRAFGFQEAMRRGLRRYSLEELLGFPAALLRADRTLKSRGIAPRAVLEELVDRLTRSGALNTTAERR
jgi:DNA polymerase-3 subunit delta